MKKNVGKILIASTIILLLVVIVCCCIGAVNIKISEAFKILINKIFNINIDISEIKTSSQTIIWKIRFPRILVALLVGGTLSVAGATYQA